MRVEEISSPCGVCGVSFGFCEEILASEISQKKEYRRLG